MATKEQRREACVQEAYELAKTGRFIDYLGIENALSSKYPEARDWLDRNSLREDLRALCDSARKQRR